MAGYRSSSAVLVMGAVVSACGAWDRSDLQDGAGQLRDEVPA
jgi:hypothetical protein